MRRLTVAALVVLLVGCGDSGPTGPQTPDVSGTWRFSYNNMNGATSAGTANCVVASLDFQITQTGSSFSGVQVGTANLSCTVNGMNVLSEPFSGETLVSGQLNGNQVSFMLGTIPGTHTGTVSGTSMTGTAQWTITDGVSTLTLTGNFSAARF